MKGFGDIEERKKGATKNRSNSLVDLALQNHANGKIDEAFTQYKQIINAGINDPRVYSGLGLIALQNSMIDEALRYNMKSISISPYYAPAYSNVGVILVHKGDLKEAEKYIRKAILINPRSASSFLNLADILYKRIELKEAKYNIRKAINIQPNNISAYYLLSKVYRSNGEYSKAEDTIKKVINIDKDKSDSYCLLAEIYKETGNFLKARDNLYKAITLNRQFANAFYSLSCLSNCHEDKVLNDELIKIDIDKLPTKKDRIDFYFAKSNFFHNKGLFDESAKSLQKANDLKLSLYPSSADQLISKSNEYLINSGKFINDNRLDAKHEEECIFIVGMPRSGSTLLETILSANKNVIDLGEKPLFEKSLQDLLIYSAQPNFANKLYNSYLRERSKFIKNKTISTDKYLYNYLYLGYILTAIPSAKVIHCFRNPLDNILSLYRANFGEGVRFSSSLKDCARVYLDQEKTMNEYKNRFNSKIYSFNYDAMVSNLEIEIKRLIDWLSWDWDDAYLSPHMVNRNVKTASVIQVRSPINSKSLGGWTNYRDMLRPAMKLLKDY